MPRATTTSIAGWLTPSRLLQEQAPARGRDGERAPEGGGHAVGELGEALVVHIALGLEHLEQVGERAKPLRPARHVGLARLVDDLVAQRARLRQALGERREGRI